MNIVNTLAITASCLVFWQAQASGFAPTRIEPEVFGPDCSTFQAFLPWSGCHETKPHPIDEGDDTPPTQRPEPPKETECSSLWTPGAILAISQVPEKECA